MVNHSKAATRRQKGRSSAEWLLGWSYRHFVISDHSSFFDASAELSRVMISIQTRYPMVRLSKESLFNQAGVAHIFGQKVRVTPTWSHRNRIAPWSARHCHVTKHTCRPQFDSLAMFQRTPARVLEQCGSRGQFFRRLKLA